MDADSVHHSLLLLVSVLGLLVVGWRVIAAIVRLSRIIAAAPSDESYVGRGGILLVPLVLAPLAGGVLGAAALLVPASQAWLGLWTDLFLGGELPDIAIVDSWFLATVLLGFLCGVWFALTLLLRQASARRAGRGTLRWGRALAITAFAIAALVPLAYAAIWVVCLNTPAGMG